jgi:hypothetical protein
MERNNDIRRELANIYRLAFQLGQDNTGDREVHMNRLAEVIALLIIGREEDHGEEEGREEEEGGEEEEEKKRLFPIEIQCSTRISGFECAICLEKCKNTKGVLLDCKHTFCGSCISASLDICSSNYKDPTCALCRNTYKNVYVRTNALKSKLKKYMI